MRSLRVLLFSLFGSVVGGMIFAGSAFADTPEARLKEMMGALKSSGSPGALISYVDWSSALKEIPEAQRKAANIDSPEALKGYMEKMYKDPTKFMKAELDREIEQLPPAQQQMMAGQIDAMHQAMDKQMKEAEVKIKNTEYQVGKATVDGDKAKVELIQIYEGKKHTEEIPLVKVNDNWYLPALRDYSDFVREDDKQAKKQMPGKTP